MLASINYLGKKGLLSTEHFGEMSYSSYFVSVISVTWKQSQYYYSVGKTLDV